MRKNREIIVNGRNQHLRYSGPAATIEAEAIRREFPKGRADVRIITVP